MRISSIFNIINASYYKDGNGINQKIVAAIIQIGYNPQGVLVFLRLTICYTVYTAKLSRILVPLYIVAFNWFIS